MRKHICNNCGKIVAGKCDCKPSRFSPVKKKNQDSSKDLKTAKWQRKRAEIIRRDNGYCQRCFIKHKIINEENIQVHHIKSRRDFPELMYENSNLITICGHCNNELGTSNKLDFDWNYEEKEIEYSL